MLGLPIDVTAVCLLKLRLKKVLKLSFHKTANNIQSINLRYRISHQRRIRFSYSKGNFRRLNPGRWQKSKVA